MTGGIDGWEGMRRIARRVAEENEKAERRKRPARTVVFVLEVAFIFALWSVIFAAMVWRLSEM